MLRVSGFVLLILVMLFWGAGCEKSAEREAQFSARTVIEEEAYQAALEIERLRQENHRLREAVTVLELRLKKWEIYLPNPKVGEKIVEGNIIAVDKHNREITIAPNPDDIVSKVNPKIKLLEKAWLQERVVEYTPNGLKVLEVRNMMGPQELEFLQVGDAVSFTYLADREAAKTATVTRVVK